MKIVACVAFVFLCVFASTTRAHDVEGEHDHDDDLTWNINHANFEPENQDCIDDEDCIIIDWRSGWGCCHADHMCEVIDWTQNDFDAVNKEWYELGASVLCPHSAASCPDLIEAGCPNTYEETDIVPRCEWDKCTKARESSLRAETKLGLWIGAGAVLVIAGVVAYTHRTPAAKFVEFDRSDSDPKMGGGDGTAPAQLDSYDPTTASTEVGEADTKAGNSSDVRAPVESSNQVAANNDTNNTTTEGVGKEGGETSEGVDETLDGMEEIDLGAGSV